MITKGQINWAEKEESAKSMSIEALRYSVRDCLNASNASKGWNPENEGYYFDEASIYASELRRRRESCDPTMLVCE